MNRKQLILLLAALVVLGGAGLMLRNRNQESWSTAGTKLGEKLLPNFQMNDVATIKITGATDLTLDEKNDRWVVQEREDYPADFSQIKELLIKMGDLKIAQAEPIGPSQLSRMHLAAPGGGPEAATLLEFKNKQAGAITSILLGKKHAHKSERPASPFGGDSEMADGRYVMLKGDSNEVLTVSDPLNSVDPKAAQWLDKDFFKVEKPKSIAFESTNAADSWSLSRAGESSPWILAAVKTGEILDSNKVSSLASTLSEPSFVDVVANPTPATTGLDKPLVLTISTFDNFSYTIKIGKKTAENGYNLTMAVAADFPTKRVAAKDEKPEYTKTADKEFQDKLKQFQDKLKLEQSLDHWTYLVNNWLIDPLIRDRSQLMVDKKDDKKKDASAGKDESDKSPDAGPVFPPPDGKDQ